MPRIELVATKLDDDRERPPGKPGPRHNASMSELPSFAELATAPQTPLDLLALALAAEFRGVAAYRFSYPWCTSKLLAEPESRSPAPDCRATS